MSSPFYELYKNYTKDALLDIVMHEENYREEAVAAAQQIISENNWTEDFEAELKKREQVQIEEENKEDLELEANILYYQKAKEFKNDACSFQVRFIDIPKLESKLIKANISFFIEDKHVGNQLDAFPTQTYYVKQKDAEEVDRIIKEIGVVAAPYLDTRPFLTPTLKVTLIAVLLIIILLLLMK
jgi:hypothetical protein